jgi:protease-4
MKGPHWVLLTLLVLAFLGGSFFFFLGMLLSLMKEPSQTGDVAVVEIIGGIFEAKPVVEQLHDLKKEKRVKAVVLRIDSPGGSVGASQEIFETVRDLKEVKPVVASMGTVAASGGYYVAAPATKIVANPGTITGSIGVRMDLVNVEDLLRWAQVKPTTLKSGALKDAGSPTRPMTPEEKAYLEGILRQMHEQFKKSVAESRGLSPEETETIADGRVFTGLEARDRKLVDELGTLNTAVKIAGELAGLKEEPEVFYPPLEEKKMLDYLIEGAVESFTDKLFYIFMSPLRFSYESY